MTATLEQFRTAAENADTPLPADIIVDGILHRFTVPGDRAKSDNGWYVFHHGEVAAGAFGCWKRGISETWCSKSYQTMTPAEKTAHIANMEVMKKAREVEQARVHAECREWCSDTWPKAKDATNANPYLKSKGVNAYGLKCFKDSLLVPVWDPWRNIVGMQFIFPDGTKKFKTGSVKAGNSFQIGNISDDGIIIICEGYATGATIHEATKQCVVVAFDAGNLLESARMVRTWGKQHKIIIAADDDHNTAGNPGLTKATEAARDVGGLLAVPVFPSSRGAKDTDFNDLHKISGIGTVKKQIGSAVVVVDQEPQEAAGETKGFEYIEPAAPVFDLSRLRTGAEISAGDYHVNYIIDKLLPEDSITLFYAKGGSGKSTLATQIGGSVETGTPFLGLDTQKRTVVIVDYENPMAILKRRIDVVEGADNVVFWAGQDKPPQLNKPEWEDLKNLVTTLDHPLLIIDTLSSSCSGADILSNKEYAPIMARIVALRNLGATIILLHHTPKQDATKYIGASVIYNQCDHIVAMYPVKSVGQEAEATDDDEAHTYRLGTKDKTRFEHHHLFVEFDDDNGIFKRAEDPQKYILDQLLKIITGCPGIIQTDIICRIGAVASEKKIRGLLKNNEGRLWIIEKLPKNAKSFYPISVWQSGTPIYTDQTAKQKPSVVNDPTKHPCNDTIQGSINTEFGSLAQPITKQAKHPEIEDADFSEIPDFDLSDAA
jgi:phage/plasmid primase-like uncharacterized protein